MSGNYTVLLLLFLSFGVSRAATVQWDGGGADNLWSTPENWSSDAVPLAGDEIVIANGDTVQLAAIEYLPNGSDLTLSGGSVLHKDSGAIRLSGCTLNLASDGALSGDFWDLDNAAIYFEDGASVNIDDWENKGSNYFSFELSSTGFAKLNADKFWIGGGTSIADATYRVDLADYSGPLHDIILVDYTENKSSVTSSNFQDATIIIENAGARPYHLEFDEINHDIVLAVTGTVAATHGLAVVFDESAVPVSLINPEGDELLSNTSSKGFYLQELDYSERRFDTLIDLGGGGYRFGISGSTEQFDLFIGGTNDYMTMRFLDLSGFALAGERFYFSLNGQSQNLQELELDCMVKANANRSVFRVERQNLWETSNSNKLGAFALYEFKDTVQEDETLLDLWVNEGLPHPAVTGVWDRATAEAWLDDWVEMAYDTSYLNIVPDTVEEHDDFIPYAASMDAKAIYMWNSIWRGEYWLHYRQNDEVNPDMYPAGQTNLQAFSDGLAENGMSLMLHYLCGTIGEEDVEFTAGAVHPDLQSWGTVTLTQSISAASTSFTVVPDPGVALPVKSSSAYPVEAPPVIPSFFEFKTFRLGDEWISASSVTDHGNGTWQLDGVERGKWNTVADSYSPGEGLRGYLRPYNQDFVPDPNAALFDTIATRWAELNNALGTTKSEFDGFENHRATGSWGAEKFAATVYENLDHPSTANTSEGRPPNAWIEYRFNRVKDALGGTFQTRQHAALFLGDKSRITPGLEEIEHEMNKFMNLNNRGFSLGSYDVKGMSLNTLQTHGQMDAVLDLVRDWKDASFALTPAERASMENFRGYDGARSSINGNHPWAESHWRLDGSDFRKWHALGTDQYTHEWHFGQEHGTITPRFYVQNGQSQSLEVPVEFDSGADQTRIVGRVLPRFDPASVGNIDLMPYIGTNALTVAATNSTGSGIWKDTDFNVYSIWPRVDFLNHRGIGCWVTGDGSGAVLVIRVKRNDNARDYAVPIDFTGTRWIEIPTAEQAWRLRNWGWAVATRKFMDYAGVSSVEVGIGHLPANTTCSVLIEDLQGLEENSETLVNPSFSLGEQTLNITGSIPVEHHFILEPNGDFTVYDEDWNTVSFQALESPFVPTNLTTFSMSSATASSNVWIEVGVQTSSESLHNPAYTTNGTPWRWLGEYGLDTDLIDEDVDGHWTWQEYIAGTNPTNLSSVLKLSGVASSGNSHVLSWQAVMGKSYSIHFATNLVAPIWVEQDSGIPGIEPDCTHTAIVHGATGFFRVEVE
ncbi:hypothetical protein PDESU_06298 [Pontiella desulfatans]|uniref:Uncharacterized protein n=1 Tax=Pontiella desulfatans TaxID=2750659 RepID=A0A6C2UER0_PONDE|nr:hypothetical protein [Pontiella desulfatans]VGO17696.1 hypothetical protein PDESU_06298 [Pontiella desulfatans]